jgi:hypothetical protein
MRIYARLRSWLPWMGACALVLTLGACARPPAGPSAAASVTPVPAGSARIWFYREYEPSVSLNIAQVALNGAPAAVVQPDGSVSYRDVPAGHYHITVESFGQDVNQTKDVDLGPGQEAFVKILAASDWESGGDTYQYRRDTFYVSLVPPQVARAELANRPLSGG